MQSVEIPQLIKYSMTPIDEGVLLCIWEPAPLSESRVRPFLFMARYRLASETEAQQILEYYETIYEAAPTETPA
ncbi:MAG: hypothetical protein HC881_18195 [Leptolyngbyaceae cyanobacterium SL_7_1]|nr:hypothetical protein [Leptolyngbyaceae cyanobacterium SL_7_1]